MQKINLNLIDEESFVEERITYKQIDLDNKKIRIITDGGMLNNDDYLEKVEINIENWHQLNVSQKDNDTIVILNSREVEFINSILKFVHMDKKLILSDVGHECWIEWEFLSPTITIYGEPQKKGG